VSAIRFYGGGLIGNRLLGTSKRAESITSFRIGVDVYEWSKDYPVSLQEKPKEPTEFTVEFKLEDGEIVEFKNAIGSSLNGTLPIHISIDQSSNCSITVKSRAKGKKVLPQKVERLPDSLREN
jgi:hypothetical protein